jgi:hypothetical protein
MSESNGQLSSSSGAKMARRNAESENGNGESVAAAGGNEMQSKRRRGERKWHGSSSKSVISKRQWRMKWRGGGIENGVAAAKNMAASAGVCHESQRQRKA